MNCCFLGGLPTGFHGLSTIAPPSKALFHLASQGVSSGHSCLSAQHALSQAAAAVPIPPAETKTGKF